jgi:diguanylate cyclase (GGDEF)-like protein
MTDSSSDCLDPDALIAEVDRLRADVAQLQERIEVLDRLAHHDAVVPLPNRRGFIRHLEHVIARIDRYGDHAALLFVDVDDLKALNDSFGHPAGDAALLLVAKVLVEGVRQSDCVARYGGDEFAILLERAGEDEARDTAERLTNAVADAGFVYAGHAIPLSVAIGVTGIAPGDYPEAVLTRADRAMYARKGAI